MCGKRAGEIVPGLGSSMNKAWHQEEDWGSSKARVGYPKGIRGNVIKGCGLGNIQRVLQIRMRNSNLIQKPQDRVKDQNNTVTEARDNKHDICNTPEEWWTEDKPSHGDQGKSLDWKDRKKDEFPWDNTAKDTATPGKDLNMEKERARSDVGSYPGSTQDRSWEGLGKQAAAWFLQTGCVMAARETRPDVRWKRLEGRLKTRAEIQKLLIWEQCFPTSVPSETKPHSI